MCTARGFPIPAIVWIHNDQVLNETDRINTTTEINEEFNEITSILTVYDTVLSDTGLYHCIALNLPVYQPVASDKVIVLVQGNFYTLISLKIITIVQLYFYRCS